MGPPSHVRSVVDRNVCMRHIPVHSTTFVQRRNAYRHISQNVSPSLSEPRLYLHLFSLLNTLWKVRSSSLATSSAAAIFTHISSTDTFLYTTAPEGKPNALNSVRNTAFTNHEVVPYTRTCVRGVKIQNQSFVTSAADGSDGLASRRGHFNPGTH